MAASGGPEKNNAVREWEQEQEKKLEAMTKVYNSVRDAHTNLMDD